MADPHRLDRRANDHVSRNVTAAIAVTLLLIAAVGCGGSGDNSDASATKSTTTTTTTTTVPLGSESNPHPQPMGIGDWTNLTIAAPEPVDAGNGVPALWSSYMQPGQMWMRTMVKATFSNTQATNGDPAQLVRYFVLMGTKGKQYDPVPVSVGSAFNPEASARYDLLSSKGPVVAPGQVSGYIYFLPDANDTALAPHIRGDAAGGWIAPLSP